MKAVLKQELNVDDIPVIQAEAEHNGLRFVHHKEKNRWAAVKFVL